jgi:3D (Asp-Asp-Asp) domain-containing protein
MRKWAVGLILLVTGCFVSRVRTTPAQDYVEPPDWLFEEVADTGPGVPDARYLGRFKVTFYWVVEERDYPASNAVPLYDKQGNLVGRFSRQFVNDFKREAAARLKDGRCISYMKRAGRVMVDTVFHGINGYTLTELKSIAVDPRVIPIGARVYIPQAERVVVNGSPLSGIFRAEDIGSAVKGKHIDVFVGSRENARAFGASGMRSLGSVDVYILE